ncbi:maleylpyruvate isomerase N-terminal domain-containing protein [Actinomycetospora endophytica]|uniref:Maleylpyruvate isomerase N-terminal domain-containing protein n=1 Tax=Actinomycetospora endophytica TaxID=2291215 RepID=A0ABS8PDK1_9PSEU|nr:maleylpyruvate isomerase N-terminal domain-containing protein [Actinomycetospora endophytica]MCD2196063.1 maleylpyruvate isomerase N-terminal domain-containing protein [Actinomycetospora endophytica]
MPVSLGDAYRGAFTRLDTRLRALAATDASSLDTLVPACPGWTVHGVVSHLSGIAVDIVAGRLRGIPDDEWTAGQVDQRLGVPVEEVLDEWAPHVDTIVAGLDSRAVPPPAAADVLTHEGDIAEALADPMPPEDGWHDASRLLCRGMVRGVDRAGTLTVRCGDDEWSGGSGGDGPVAAVDVDRWELFRGVFSRRSADQMRAWSWDGDPDPWLASLTVFGLRTDDQPRCAPPS